MTAACNAPAQAAKQIEHLYWPPKHLLASTATDNDRVDLLTYLDAEVYNTRGSYPLKLPYGITVLRDRVVLEMERFNSPSRDHQTALASQFQASFAEQGFAVVVKEWANTSQKRSILRVRLKCRFAGCKFHFQINWDSNMGYWFISRRRCGIFQHSCRAKEGPSPLERLMNKRHHQVPPSSTETPKPAAYAAPPAKRARSDSLSHHVVHPHYLQCHPHHPHEGETKQPFLITPPTTANATVSLRSVSTEQPPSSSSSAEQSTVTAKTAGSSEQHIDFAESLLELSKGTKDSPDKSGQPQDREPQEKASKKLDSKRDAKQAPAKPLAPPPQHVPTRQVVLGEIPHGTQAFAQMASTMGPSMFTHLVHGRGEMTLTMSFDGEGFVLRSSVPAVPPPLPPPPSRSMAEANKSAHAPLNYPYLPPRRFPPSGASAPPGDRNVVML